MGKKLSDEDFIRMYEQYGPSHIARLLATRLRNVHTRKRDLQNKYNKKINSPMINSSNVGLSAYTARFPARVPVSLPTGCLVIGSDAHYWPGIISTAHKGFLKIIQELKPDYIILNGDVFDGAKISRHPPLGFASLPTPADEIECIGERTSEMVAVSPRSKLLWTIGNHDARFEAKLASTNAEFSGVDGFSLHDHFPQWQLAMSFWVNDSVVIKHRFKGGIHATHNNAVNAGKTIVTGHLHSLKVTPFSDYNGVRYGVDTGTLADPYGPQFAYSEDNPNNQRSGFIVLTFVDGLLLQPEIVRVIKEGVIEFRGKLIHV